MKPGLGIDPPGENGGWDIYKKCAIKYNVGDEYLFSVGDVRVVHTFHNGR